MNPFRSPIYFIFSLGAILMFVGIGIMLIGPIDFKNYGQLSSAVGIILVFLPPTIAGIHFLLGQFMKIRKQVNSGE